MEKAIHITNFKNLRFFKKNEYRRIYWGVEFCQNLIPTVRDTEKILRFTREDGLGFSLVTPFVTEQGLSRLNELLQFLKARLNNCEVVVNDWGVLELLSTKFKTFKLSLGRLLTRQSRDPAMANVLKKQPLLGIRSKDGKIGIIVHAPPGKRYQSGIRACYVNAPLVQKFLSKFKIDRIELNNLIQGLNLENLKVKVSLYTPFVNIATTRFCPMESHFQKIYRINVCNRECQKSYSQLRNKALPKLIYKRGNTIFYKNPVNLNSINGAIIDRIVVQPQLPF